MTTEQEIERLTRERDLAQEVAKEAMRLLPDEELKELRRRLEQGDPDDSERDPGDEAEAARTAD
jgi:hypothetical protein